MAPYTEKETGVFHVILVGAMAWAVPGGGYWVLGDRRRALVVGVTVAATFILGLYIGSIAVVDSLGARYWYAAQVMTSPAVLVVGRYAASGAYLAYGKPYELGQIYTSIAGLLNLLCIINAVYIAHLRQRSAQESPA
jgi:hypothetical protein